MNKQKEGKGKLQQEATLIVSSFLERLPIRLTLLCDSGEPAAARGSVKGTNLSKRPAEAKVPHAGHMQELMQPDRMGLALQAAGEARVKHGRKQQMGTGRGRTLGTERTATEAEWEESNSRFKMQPKALEWEAQERRCSDSEECGTAPEKLLWIN